MINYLILTKTNSDKIYNMTNDLIQSLNNTIYPIQSSFSKYRIILIQSQKNCQYIYRNNNVITIQYDNNIFNYNHALNQGIEYCLTIYQQNNWFCCMNNDILCDKNWIQQIDNVYKKDKQILSFCPGTTYIKDEYQYGYILGKHMIGYCFLFNKEILQNVDIFDESFNFYFQDDDYIELLRMNNIKHVSVKNSIVNHIGQQTQSTNFQELFKGRNIFIKKYSLQTYLNREKQKSEKDMNMGKIGIGIITYNRQQKFKKLYDSIKNNNDIDKIIIIKNKDIDYHSNDPNLIKNQKTQYINVLEDVGVGACKNKAMQYLIDQDCDHIFIIQDDVIIKRDDVFKKYIQTAYHFGLQHLNFCRCFITHENNFQNPIGNISLTNDIGLELFRNLCGVFEYFTKNVLLKVGLMDEHYINALEHADHTYRISKAGYYIPPFHLFADIKNSNLYLEDGGIETTINKNQKYNENLKNAFDYFKNKFGIAINRLSLPTTKDLQEFFKKRIK